VLVLAVGSIGSNLRPLFVSSKVARRSKLRGENSRVSISRGLPLLPRLIMIH
jgi:hypothetical protein